MNLVFAYFKIDFIDVTFNRSDLAVHLNKTVLIIIILIKILKFKCTFN